MLLKGVGFCFATSIVVPASIQPLQSITFFVTISLEATPSADFLEVMIMVLLLWLDYDSANGRFDSDVQYYVKEIFNVAGIFSRIVWHTLLCFILNLYALILRRVVIILTSVPVFCFREVIFRQVGSSVTDIDIVFTSELNECVLRTGLKR